MHSNRADKITITFGGCQVGCDGRRADDVKTDGRTEKAVWRNKEKMPSIVPAWDDTWSEAG